MRLKLRHTCGLGLVLLGLLTAPAEAAVVSYTSSGDGLDTAQFTDVRHVANVATPFRLDRATRFDQLRFQPAIANGNGPDTKGLRVAVFRDRDSLPQSQANWVRTFTARCVAAGLDLQGRTLETFEGSFGSILLGPGLYWFALIGATDSGPIAAPEIETTQSAFGTDPTGMGFTETSNWYDGDQLDQDRSTDLSAPPPALIPPSPVPLPASLSVLIVALGLLRLGRTRTA